MNLVENYLEPGYTVKPWKNKTINGEPLIMFDGFINCYGNVTHQHRVWLLTEWREIKKKGYFLG